MRYNLEDFLNRSGKLDSLDIAEAERRGFAPDNPLIKTVLAFLRGAEDKESNGSVHYYDPLDEDTLVDYNFNLGGWFKIRHGQDTWIGRINFYSFPKTIYIPLDALPSDDEIEQDKIGLKTGKFITSKHATRYELSLDGKVGSDFVEIQLKYDEDGHYHSNFEELEKVYKNGGFITPEKLKTWITARKRALEETANKSFL